MSLKDTFIYWLIAMNFNSANLGKSVKFDKLSIYTLKIVSLRYMVHVYIHVVPSFTGA